MKQHEDRRNEILDTAQTLFYREGYEATSVATIIDEVGVAKGTFYHYFSSKEQLLDELLDRGYRELYPLIEGIASESDRSAIDRINEVYSISTSWKADNRELVIESVRMMFRDENIRLRNKNDEKATAMFAPALSRIVEQGVARGELDTPHPADAGQVMFVLSRGMSNVIAALFLEAVKDSSFVEPLIHKLKVLETAIERIIGAPEGSIRLANTEDLLRMLGRKHASGNKEARS